MKKILSAVLLTLSTAAVADTGNTLNLSYAFRDTVASSKDHPNRQGVTATFTHKFNSNWAVDINEQFRTERLNAEDGNSSTRVEGGVTYSQPLTQDIVFYTRAGLGYKFASSYDAAYYAVEPGVKFQLTQPLNVRVAYRYRDTFNDSIKDKTDTVRFGAEYALTKEHVITAGVDRFYGDSEAIGYNLGYSYKF